MIVSLYHSIWVMQMRNNPWLSEEKENGDWIDVNKIERESFIGYLQKNMMLIF